MDTVNTRAMRMVSCLRGRVLVAALLALLIPTTEAIGQRAEPDALAAAFLRAVAGGDADAIRTLAAQGIDIDAPIDGRTAPLALAIVFGQLASVEALLDLGAEVPAGYRDARAIDALRQIHGDELADLLLGAVGGGARGATGGPGSGGHPLLDAPGAYPAGHVSGRCDFTANEDAFVRNRPRHARLQRVVTSIFRGVAPEYPVRVRADCRGQPDGTSQCTVDPPQETWFDRTAVGMMSAAPIPSAAYRIEPPACEAVNLPPGQYTAYIESFEHEEVVQCRDPDCVRLYTSRTLSTAERERIENIRVYCSAAAWSRATIAQAVETYTERLRERHRVEAGIQVHEQTLARCEAGELRGNPCRAAQHAIDRVMNPIRRRAGDCGRILGILSSGSAWTEFTSCLESDGHGTLAGNLESSCSPVDACERIHTSVLSYAGNSVEQTWRFLPPCFRQLYRRPRDLCAFARC